jgi:3-polyprenyl-4-hydroxybenzoate decarboxylase
MNTLACSSIRSALVPSRLVGRGTAFTSIAVFMVLPFAMEAYALRARQRVHIRSALVPSRLVGRDTAFTSIAAAGDFPHSSLLIVPCSPPALSGIVLFYAFLCNL